MVCPSGVKPVIRLQKPVVVAGGGRDGDPREPDVLLVGPYPPPFGGVAAHVERLAAAIQREGMTVGVLNHGRSVRPGHLILGDLHRNPIRYWRALRRHSGSVVHYHHSRWVTLLATALALSRVKDGFSVITVHGQGLLRTLDSAHPVLRQLTGRAISSFDEVVVVSPEIAQALKNALPHRTIHVIPAYLPAELGNGWGTVSQDLHSFLKRGRPTLLVSAYRAVADNSGSTVYGLEFALEVFLAISTDHANAQLAMLIACHPHSRAERERIAWLSGRIAAAGVADRIRVCVGEPLPPAFAHDCVYLRPTTTDGDAISIREALAAGRAVIASDVVARPPGVKTLPLATDAWRAAVLQAIDKPHGRVQGQANVYLEALLGLYRIPRPRIDPATPLPVRRGTVP